MRFQRLLFKLYIFLLPFNLLPGLNYIKNSISSSAHIENGFFILIIGLLLIVIAGNGKVRISKGELSTEGIKTCLTLIVISSITSAVLYYPFGELNGENTIIASLPSSVYMLVTALAFYYNARMFKLLSKESLCELLDKLCIIMYVIGYFQILILSFPSLGIIYDKLDILGILVDSSQIQNMGRITLTATEPSFCGEIICVLLLPYVLSKLLVRDRKYYLFFLLFLPLAFYTYSSTVYIGVVADVGLYTIYKCKDAKKSGHWKNIVLAIVIGVPLLLLGGVWFLNNTEIGRGFSYYLFNKTKMVGDMSAEVRYSTVITDMHAFVRYPLTGVGNGNQGYFYNEVVSKYLSQRTFYYSEIINKVNGSSGIVNGGAFVPAFISGYGILGVCLAIRFVRKCCKVIKDNTEQYGYLGYMYKIGGGGFLVIACAAAGLDGSFLPIFVLSLPFILQNKRNDPISVE